jgi:hypothetical protein
MSLHTEQTEGSYRPVGTSQGAVWTPTVLAHPDEILGNPHLSLDEKRAVLASWLSDAHAVPDAPAWRQRDDGAFVKVEDVLEALKSLDNQGSSDRKQPSGSQKPSPFRWRRRSRRWIDSAIRRKQRDDDDDDPPPTPVTSRLPPHCPFPAGSVEPVLMEWAA